MLTDLENRDEARAARVHVILSDAALASLGGGNTATNDPAFYDPGGALQAARLVWHLLDRAARHQWLGAWNQVLPARLLHA